MNILITNYSEVTSPGGVHKTILELAKNFSLIGHKVTVLQTNPFSLPMEEMYDGFKIIRINSSLGRFFYGLHPELFLYLKKNLKKLNPDIIHVHGYHTLFSPEIIYLIRRINPRILIFFSPHFGNFSHNTLAGKYLWKPYNRLIGRSIMRNTNLIIAASNFEANNISDIFNISENKISIIPHGVDHIDLSKKNRLDDKITLLYVGYLLELKGINYIIEALNELVYKKGVKVQLTIAGNGSYEHELRKLATELNVNQFINWKGFIFSGELKEEFKKADICLLLSKSENFGIVVLEALALGTPVIVTKIPALEEFLIEPGCFGVNYPPNSNEVTELILKIYESNMNVGPFSYKIRQWCDVVKDYEILYYEFLNR